MPYMRENHGGSPTTLNRYGFRARVTRSIRKQSMYIHTVRM